MFLVVRRHCIWLGLGEGFLLRGRLHRARSIVPSNSSPLALGFVSPDLGSGPALKESAQGGAGAISAAAGAAFEVGISQALGLPAARLEKGKKNLGILFFGRPYFSMNFP